LRWGQKNQANLSYKGIEMSSMRYIAYFLVVFSGFCWLGAAWIGISHSGTDLTPSTYGLLNMMNGAGMLSALISIALGIWFKE
jgi:hypothetical protein